LKNGSFQLNRVVSRIFPLVSYETKGQDSGSTLIGLDLETGFGRTLPASVFQKYFYLRKFNNFFSASILPYLTAITNNYSMYLQCTCRFLGISHTSDESSFPPLNKAISNR